MELSNRQKAIATYNALKAQHKFNEKLENIKAAGLDRKK